MIRRVAAPRALSLLAAALIGLAHPPLLADDVGGPLVLMGIDAEDHWRTSANGTEGGQHGPIANYANVASSILAKVTNDRTGLLVIGGGKNASDDVTTFWAEIGARVDQPVTFVNTAERIRSQSFGGFAMLVVVSDETNTPSGGLTDAENDALTERQGDVARFVNNGGGLFGLTSDFTLSDPYGYIAGIGSFETIPDIAATIEDIFPTEEGERLGITDALDVCCWHDAFGRFPDFLQILAIDLPVTGQPVALGGTAVFVPTVRGQVTGYMKLGGGAIANTGVRHWFRLGCDPLSRGPLERLRVRFANTEFHLDDILTATCTATNPKKGKGGFDTHTGSGSGHLNNRPGVYSVVWTFTDSGTHKGDFASIVIRDPSGNGVLDVAGNLSQGDQQAYARVQK